MSAVADDPAVARAGARGLLRFGNGRVLMHWFHVLPKLLETLRDAEDDEAALRGGCRWLTREAGASKAAIVDEPRHRLIAAEGWTSADFRAGRVSPPRGNLAEAGQVREAPVRYGGERIGYVVATGDTAEGETLQSATEAMAALMAPALRTRLDAISSSTRARATLLPEILGCSPALQALRHDIARAAAVPFPVLIEGESGTGKELVARAIHRLSARRDKRFCALNCAALPDDLFEAELFGHARGAFTGAVAMRAGLIEEAHTGSLFLDEVSELSPRAQAKLLRVVQEREVRRVGENASRPVDVRLISATNVPLTTAVDVGRFRADLQYRLAVVRFSLPPLRDRIEDVPILAQAFWAEATRTAAKQARLGHDALAQLCRHGWPGNVRELQNVIAALVVMAPERGRVAARHVERAIGDRRDGVVVSLDDARTSFERQAVASALARHAGRRSAAARELGMTRQGLTKALKRLGLETTGKRIGVA
jgi:transcriptional regulator with PAS, ATPase and Fis domain